MCCESDRLNVHTAFSSLVSPLTLPPPLLYSSGLLATAGFLQLRLSLCVSPLPLPPAQLRSGMAGAWPLPSAHSFPLPHGRPGQQSVPHSWGTGGSPLGLGRGTD